MVAECATKSYHVAIFYLLLKMVDRLHILLLIFSIFCGDKYGLPIGNYGAPIGSELANEMNCSKLYFFNLYNCLYK